MGWRSARAAGTVDSSSGPDYGQCQPAIERERKSEVHRHPKTSQSKIERPFFYQTTSTPYYLATLAAAYSPSVTRPSAQALRRRGRTLLFATRLVRTSTVGPGQTLLCLAKGHSSLRLPFFPLRTLSPSRSLTLINSLFPVFEVSTYERRNHYQLTENGCYWYKAAAGLLVEHRRLRLRSLSLPPTGLSACVLLAGSSEYWIRCEQTCIELRRAASGALLCCVAEIGEDALSFKRMLADCALQRVRHDVEREWTLELLSIASVGHHVIVIVVVLCIVCVGRQQIKQWRHVVVAQSALGGA